MRQILITAPQGSAREVAGIAFAAGANWGNVGGDPVWRNAFHRKQAKPEAQGYYIFAVSKK